MITLHGINISQRVFTCLPPCCFRWKRWTWTVRAAPPGSWTPKIPSAPSAPSTRPPYSDWTLLSSASRPLTPFPFALCLHSLDRLWPPLALLHTEATSPFTSFFSVCLTQSWSLVLLWLSNNPFLRLKQTSTLTRDSLPFKLIQDPLSPVVVS